MEYGSIEILNCSAPGKDENIVANKVAEPGQTENLKEDPKHPLGSLGDMVCQSGNSLGGRCVSSGAVQAGMAASGEVNMEASISSDDVIRAGGFGARDDINSFLPVASDSTDFEASLLDAREYEDPQEEIRRPGLGWKGATK